MPADDRSTPITAKVARLGQSGDGVIETPRGAIYVPGVLPGETVSLVDGVPGPVVGPLSPDRRQPLCTHVARCGGCAVQHLADVSYRTWKAGLLTEALAGSGIGTTPLPMFVVPLRSRRRAVLSARRSGRDTIIGFHSRRSDEIEPLVDCAILKPAIVAGVPGLVRLSGELLPPDAETHITVIETSTGLDVAFDTGRKDLSADARQRLAATATASRFARVSVAGDPVVIRHAPVLDMAGVAVVPPPGAFIQASAAAETHMAGLVVEALGKARRVADLFSGLGTFAFAMARRASVLAVDGSRDLIEALDKAQRGAAGLKPIEAKVRDLLLDPMSPRELNTLDAVVFDPPRGGAKAQAEALARSDVPVVVAVSCNPQTLARDLRILGDGGYTLKAIAPVDQFLFSPHIEAVAVLAKPKRRRRL